MDPDLGLLATALTAGMNARTSTIPAGYTYLGQMISHDLVPPTQSGAISTAKLNLDSIYAGFGPAGFPPTTPGREWDLPRRGDGSPDIPESRNDENIIIAQLHRLWQRLHEKIVQQGTSQDEAKADVVRLFQAVVIDDYLQRILQPHVFQAYFRRNESHLGFADNHLPRVFSHAAFRFGHSMVRDSYDLSSSTRNVKLSVMFPRNVIPPEHQIDWSAFFETDPKHRPQPSMGIDTSISAVMATVPDRNRNPINVVLRNLQAGKGLPTGSKYVTNLMIGDTSGAEPYPKIDPSLGLYRVANESVQVLGVTGDRLPLLPYLLLESELQGQRSRLGVLGSLIVAETLRNAIRAANVSVFQGGVYRFQLVPRTLSIGCKKLLAKAHNGNPMELERVNMPIIILMATTV